MVLLASPTFALDVPSLGTPQAGDILSAVVIAAVAVLLGLAGVYLFPHLHRVFHVTLGRNPVLPLTIAGALLGVLGVIGGPDTLFKGLTEMKDLTEKSGDLGTGQLVLVTLVKLAALLIAASAGFRGGRVFPAAFLGVAVGLAAHSVLPDIPIGLAIAAGVLGFVLVITRDGWIALFMAVTLVGDITVLPLLCIAILPVWLMVTRQPEFLIHPAPVMAESAASDAPDTAPEPPRAS